MTVAFDYQAWSSASYNWLDSADPGAVTQQITAKLNAWIAAVNANASNASKQITLLKGPTDSTSANYRGWSLKFDSSSSGATFYTRLHTTSTDNLYVVFGEGWSDDGSQGGYGAITGTFSADGSISFYTSGQIAEFAIASETTDGEEFICVGWRLANNYIYSDCLIFFKDSEGEWAGFLTDTGGPTAGTIYVADAATPQRCYGVGSYLDMNQWSNFLTTARLYANSAPTSAAYGDKYRGVAIPKSNAIYMTGTSANYGFGKWAQFNDGRIGVSMGYSTLWIVG
jgi:hypothetical protein